MSTVMTLDNLGRGMSMPLAERGYFLYPKELRVKLAADARVCLVIAYTMAAGREMSLQALEVLIDEHPEADVLNLYASIYRNPQRKRFGIQ